MKGGLVMSAVITATGDILTLAGNILDTIVANTYMLAIFATGFVFLGMRVIKGLFKTTKRV